MHPARTVAVPHLPGLTARATPHRGPLREQRDEHAKKFLLALLAAVALASLGCATPKTINGRPVIGTRWVGGKVVYVLGETAVDRQRMQEGAREAETAGKDVVFRPLK